MFSTVFHTFPKKGGPQKTRYEQLLAASPAYLRDLLIFLLGTGARLREATYLTWRDVDLDRNPRAIVRFVETKGGQPRGVPLPNHVRDLLRRLRDTAPVGEDRVFLHVRRNGTRVPYDSPKDAFRATRKRAGLPNVRIHDLRHTYASRLVQRGVSLYEVQRLLGHTTPALTQRYASLAPDNLERAVSVLDVTIDDEIVANRGAGVEPPERIKKPRTLDTPVRGSPGVNPPD